MSQSQVEWLAALFGMTGAMLLATQFHPGWGFAAFLASNAAWINFSLQRRMRGLLLQQIVFALTSLLGLWNWWLGPLVLG